MKTTHKAICALSLVLLSVGVANTQAKPGTSKQSAVNPVSLEQLRQENEKLKQQQEIREIVKNEVRAEIDRTFGWTINLINTQLFVLTVLPIFASIFAMILRSSIEQKIIDETKPRVQKEVLTDLFEAEGIKELTSQFRTKIAQLQSDAELRKNELFKKLDAMIISFPEMAASETPTTLEKQQELQNITSQLTVIDNINPEALFSPEEYLKQGEALFIAQNYEDAIECFKKAINLKADYYLAWFHQGWAQKRLGRYQEAIKSYDEGLRFKDDDSRGWYGRGNVLKELKQYQEAIYSYKKALLLNPNDGWSWFRQACCFTLKGDVNLALQSLKNAVDINPEKFQELAKEESDFDAIRDLLEFQKMIHL
jgi:tetratricopeptide (TPR) repeat protein